MISRILQVLEKGLLVMRTNSRMLLVAILVFIFPLLFVWVTQSFFTTAYNNIKTADDHRLGNIHTAMSALLLHDQGQEVVEDMVQKLMGANEEDLRALRVLSADENGYLILFAEDTALVGTYNPSNRLLTDVGFTDSRNFIRNDFMVSGHRVWQAFSKVQTADGPLYVFTEQNFKQIDDIMAARRQQSYFGLTAIFIFLIALAYWLNKQTYWEKLHNKLSLQLEERDLFFNMVAHEFRSPLTAIKGYASFLEESKNLSDDEVRFANNINSSTERLVVLVNDFLEISRLQAGKMKIEKNEVDLRDILSQITEDLRVLAEEKDLVLKYERNAKPVILETDSARMIQVLTNIITNAIKYTESGQVELECTQIPGEVTVRVKDTGMGISAEDQQKLFAPFTRVGGVDSTSIKGTGLGMWITKQLVALLGGSIGVESIKGVGTHIVIIFRT